MFFEAKMLLCISAALKIVHVRCKENTFKSKDNKDAIGRVKGMIKAVGVHQDLTCCAVSTLVCVMQHAVIHVALD